jgi:hypothetical protein
MAIEKKENDQEILDRINGKLESIKNDLKEYYGENELRKAVLYIEHSGKPNPGNRGQAEEIEPEFFSMKFIDPQ